MGVASNQMSACESYTKESQNVKAKCYCVSGTTPTANNEDDCNAQGGSWECGGRWGLPKPSCFATEWMRDNHLGNTIPGRPHTFTWTLPSAHTSPSYSLLRFFCPISH